MSERCFRIEDLAGIAKLTADDPRRAHLSRCPRCRARLAAFEAFMLNDDLPGEADPQDAETRLTAALQREIFGDEDLPAEQATRYAATRPSRWQQFLRALTTPALRPVWGVAAALLLVVVVHEALLSDRPRVAPMVLRGEEGSPTETVAATAIREPDGDIVISWTVFPESDRCEIAFYGGNLAEIGRLDGGSGTELRISPGDLPLKAGRPGLFWRVIYLRGGDDVAQSVLVGLPTSE